MVSAEQLVELLEFLDRKNLSSMMLCALRGDRCLYLSGALCELLGISGTPRFPIAAEEVLPEYKKLRGQHCWIETELRCAGGSVRLERVFPAEIDDEFLILRVQHQPGEYLRTFHAQRLETLGMLSGGIAHDFNNVLTGILGHITYLKTILPGAGPHLESLGALEEGASKASQMTQQILNFSRLETSDEEHAIDLRDVVAKTVKLLRGAISPEFNLVSSLPKESVPVLGVEGKMAQVLVNLVINSRDSLEADGTISVSLETGTFSDEVRGIPECASSNFSNWARLTVADDGSGIPTEVLPRIFEPYFTTKVEKGTGLGLHTVRQILRETGGGISVVSNWGSGTTIKVFLPLIDASGTGLQNDRGEDHGLTNLQSGVERILIIDDDSPVRKVLAVSLEHLGYTVFTAGSGAEAISMYRAEGPFDLVVLDMLMPQQSGQQVFSKLQELDPSVRVLIMSGYSSEDAVESILRQGGLDFVPKPFTIESLSQKVRACLETVVGRPGSGSECNTAAKQVGSSAKPSGTDRRQGPVAPQGSGPERGRQAGSKPSSTGASAGGAVSGGGSKDCAPNTSKSRDRTEVTRLS